MKPKYSIACNIWKGSLVHITYITNIQEDGRVLRYPFIEKKRRNTMEGAWTNGDLEQ